MDFSLYLPIAQLKVSVIELLGVGFLGGILTGLVGIGGSIFMLPAMILMGIPPFVAITAQNYYTVGTNFTGFRAYSKAKGVDFPLAMWLSLGGIVGGMIGHFFLKNQVDHFSYTYFLGFLYLIIMCFTLISLLSNSIHLYKNQVPLAAKSRKIRSAKGVLNYLPFQVIFKRSRLKCSVLLPIMLGVVSSCITTFTGLGVGLLMVPFMIYLLGRTSRSIAGTTLLSGILLSLTAITVYVLEKTSTDFVLVFFLLIGGLVGSQLGVQIGYKLKKHTIGFIGSGIVAVVFVAFVDNFKVFTQKNSLEEFPIQLFGKTLQSYFIIDHYPYVGPFLGVVLVVFIAVLVELVINRLEAFIFNLSVVDKKS
jgi:uncharacterized membrane protein YfcA